MFRKSNKLLFRFVSAFFLFILFLLVIFHAGESQEIFVNLKKIEGIKVAREIEELDMGRLGIKILPINSSAIHLTFPDAGNMMVNTGSREDSGKLVTLLIGEFKKLGAGPGVMSVIGWKPRIDWVVLTDGLPGSSGGLAGLSEKTEISQLIIPEGAKISVPAKINKAVFRPNEKIDLMQAVSEVELVTLGDDKTRGAIYLKLNYGAFSFLFLTGKDYKSIINSLGEPAKNTIIITDKPITEKDTAVLNPVLIIPMKAKVTITTDGNKILFKDFPQEISDKLSSNQINAMYKDAEKYYEKKFFKRTYKITEEILAINPEHTPSRLLGLNSKAQVYFAAGKYNDAKNELDKVLQIDPDNKDAKMLLIRIDTVLRIMSP